MTSEPQAVLVAGRERPSEPAPALARRLVAASVMAVLGAAVCYLVMVRTPLGQRLDGAAYVGAKAQYGPAAASDTSQLHRITTDSLALALLVLVGIGAVRRRLLLGVGAALAAGIGVVGTHLLKNRILTRPELGGVHDVVNTFPSGHTASAVACAMALVLVSAPRWRGVAAVVAGAYGWVTAAQVQTAGWHRPSDAIGAALLAFASVTAVAAVLASWRPVRWHERVRHRLAFGILGLVGLVDGAVFLRGLVEVVRYLRLRSLGDPVSAGIDHDAYITGLTVTVEVVVILLAILVALLGRADLDGWGQDRPRTRTSPGAVPRARKIR